MFNSFKKRAKASWNRNKHRSNEVIRKALNTVETVSTNDSESVRSPPRTPRNALPSPPCKDGRDLPMTDVHAVLKTVDPNYADLRGSDDAIEHEKYMKLAYAVGKDFVDHLLAGSIEYKIETAKGCAKEIINMDTSDGKRFHVMNSRRLSKTNRNNKIEFAHTNTMSKARSSHTFWIFVIHIVIDFTKYFKTIRT
jgi:hypothetical protein